MRNLDRIGRAAAGLPCGEQGKLPIAKAFMPAERDKHMSEEKQLGYTQQLKAWTRSTIIHPLEQRAGGTFDPEMVEQIAEAVRVKMLESFRNGLTAKSLPVKQPQKGGQPAYVR